MLDGKLAFGVLRAVASRKSREALMQVDAAFQSGTDLKLLAQTLIELLHAAMISKVLLKTEVTEQPGSIELSAEEWSEVSEIGKLRSLGEFEMIFQVFHQGLDWMSRAPSPKLVLDIMVIKCAEAGELVYAASPSAAAPTPASGGSRAAVNTAPQPQAFANTNVNSIITPAASTRAQTQAISAAISARSQTPTPLASVAPVAAVTPVAPVMAAAMPKAAAENPTFEGLINQVRTKRPLLASVLENGVGTLPESTAQDLVIIFPKDALYYRDQLGSKTYADQFSQIAQEYLGFKPKVRVELAATDTMEAPAARRERERREKEENTKKIAQSHPMITEARSLFGGELGPIELLNGDAAP